MIVPFVPGWSRAGSTVGRSQSAARGRRAITTADPSKDTFSTTRSPPVSRRTVTAVSVG